jgi:nucleotide-binding universal stress UspA family protein
MGVYMFKKILLATSVTQSCDQAARVAFDMANRYDSQIDIFHVIGVPSHGFSQMAMDVKTKEDVVIDEEYQEWVKEEIKNYYDNQLEDANNFNIQVGIGLPHREILRSIRQNKPNILVMGGSTGNEEDSLYKKITAGSTIQRVTKAAPCPVLIVNRPSASFWGGISNIVFGTDFSKASYEAFEFAYELTKNLDAEMHLFHAIDISSIHTGHMITQDDIEVQIRESYNKIRKQYVAKMNGFKNYSIEVWEGIPYIEIVKYAREKHADLIVMAHHTRKMETEDTRLGSNIEQVIVRAGCPVVSIK